MEKHVKTTKELRQRKFLLVFPLLVLPFLTMGFWALGGGKAQRAETLSTVNKGFNLNLPDAHLNDKLMDKMSYYDQAQLDSNKYQELVRNDPNYQRLLGTGTDGDLPGEENDAIIPSKQLNTSLYGSQGHNDPSTEKIYRKLADLDKEMNRQMHPPTGQDDHRGHQRTGVRGNSDLPVNSPDVERLEEMIHAMNESTGEDPELKQLDGMLDKILAVQHPERMQEKPEQASKAYDGKVFAVTSQEKNNSITLLDNGYVSTTSANGFYSLPGAPDIENTQNAIQAVIHETQTITDGSTVKLRLVNDVFINGMHIPQDHFVFGIASLRGERLSIEINSIRYNRSLYPVQLSVYDMDGLGGIYIPGAITRDVAKQSADRSLQSLGLSTLDPSWGAQAASAGIATAKTLLSRKIKLVKVTVKAGYRVLLRDEKQKTSK